MFRKINNLAQGHPANYVAEFEPQALMSYTISPICEK